MSYMAYAQKDNEIISDRNYMMKGQSALRKQIVTYQCPYCGRVFRKLSLMYNHIKSDHNVVRPVLSINDRIIDKEKSEYFINEVTSVLLYLYDYNCNIYLDEDIINQTEDKVDLTEYVSNSLKNKDLAVLKIVKINDLEEFEIKIRKYSMDSIDIEKVSNKIVDWQGQIARGEYITNEYKGFNHSEEVLLNSYFNYFLGAISKNNYKDERYQEAAAMITNFSSLGKLELTLLKVIYFRLNWIELLDSINTHDDIFDIICAFYKREKTTFNYVEDESSPYNLLYIEKDLDLCIKAIYNYSIGEESKVVEYLKSNRVLDIAESNKRDRILYLEARMYEDHGETKKSKSKLMDILSEDFK